MKWFIGILILTLSIELMAQTTAISVIENPVVSNLSEVQELINARGAVVDYQFVNVDLNSLQNETSIRIKFFDVDMIIYRDHLERRSAESFSWFGYSEDSLNTVIFTVNDNVVNSSLMLQYENYKVETLAGKYVVEMIDVAKIPEWSCANSAPVEVNQKRSDLGQSNYRKVDGTASENPLGGELSQCKLRVLVMYTANSKDKDPNIENTIQSAIDELRLSFINGNMAMDVELVLMVETEYQEQGDVNPNYPPSGSKDLNNFRNMNDGYMDNVHSLRDQYAADICVLIFEHPIRPQGNPIY